MMQFLNQGWLCPRCKTVNAPFVAKCDCKESVATTGTQPPIGSGGSSPQYGIKCTRCGEYYTSLAAHICTVAR